LLSILPIDAVEPTPFQRDLSMLITNLTELFSRIALRVRAERFRRHESCIVGFCYWSEETLVEETLVEDQDSLVSSWSISFLSIAMGPPILNFPMAVYTVYLHPRSALTSPSL
jgi:hypothetical protein